ncbi:MAG: DEAD/DEAH box helicase [Patescibacteria group bacterium]
MSEILVINELPEDVFSKYLQGRGWNVTRRNFRDQLQTEIMNFKLESSPSGKVSPSLILLINYSHKDGLIMKRTFSSSLIILINGGKKDFSPFMSVVNEEYLDFVPFSSWKEFEFLCNVENLRKRLKENKLLTHYFNDRYYNDIGRRARMVYEINREPNFKPIKEGFSEFIKAMIYLSKLYIDWLNAWEIELINLDIPITFEYSEKNKKVKSAVAALKNNYKGLPIVREGDKIFLEDIETLVIQATDTEVTFSFGEPVSRNILSHIKSFKARPIIDLLEKKYAIFSFEALLNKKVPYGPAEFLALGEKAKSNKRDDFLNNYSTIFFSNETDKIRRDRSQVEAMIKIMGLEFFTLVVGPAATGKTFLTAAANYQFNKNNRNVLIVSHSNLGVDNLICETAKYSDDKVFRLGNDLKVISAPAQQFHCEKRFMLKDNPRKYERDYLRKNPQGLILGCTIDSFRWVSEYLKGLDIKIDVVVVDEASRGFFLDLLPVIMAARDKVVLIGDNKQLGNISLPKELMEFFEKKISEHENFSKLDLPKSLAYYFERGFFNSLIELNYFPANLLSTNRRSLEKINNLVSTVFYEGKLKTGRFNPSNSGKLTFIETLTPEKKMGTSYVNPGEANLVIAKFIMTAVNHLKQKGRITDLVIITPYMAQVHLFKKRLRKHLLFNSTLKEQVNEKNIEEILSQLVITVDAIQGGQRKFVFVSLVRSNSKGEIGFNNDIRRLNVALSRAQESLMIIGNPNPFLECQYEDIRQAFKKIMEIIKR